MKRTYTVATLGITVLGLALAALPAAAAAQLVNLRTRVEGRHEGRAPQYYGIKPSEAVPLAVGETIRVELVGTTAGATTRCAAGWPSSRRPASRRAPS